MTERAGYYVTYRRRGFKCVMSLMNLFPPVTHFLGVSVTCMRLSVCYEMRRCSVTVTTTQQVRTVSAVARASNPAAGDQDHTCPYPKALPTPVCTCTHTLATQLCFIILLRTFIDTMYSLTLTSHLTLNFILNLKPSLNTKTPLLSSADQLKCPQKTKMSSQQ